MWKAEGTGEGVYERIKERRVGRMAKGQNVVKNYNS